MISRIELDTDAEGLRHHFTDPREDVEDQTHALLGTTTVFVVAAVCLWKY